MEPAVSRWDGLGQSMLSYPPILLLGLAGERMGYSNMLPTEIYNILFLVNIPRANRGLNAVPVSCPVTVLLSLSAAQR